MSAASSHLEQLPRSLQVVLGTALLALAVFCLGFAGGNALIGAAVQTRHTARAATGASFWLAWV